MSKAGFRRNVVYLVRPDGYVGLVDSSGSATVLAQYLKNHRLTFQQ
jgi:hypothetical protein